jgi:hypothetical protein
MMHWGDKYFPQQQGPPTVLIHKGECGGTVNDRRICERCGEELSVRDVRAEHSAPISAGLAELLSA